MHAPPVRPQSASRCVPTTAFPAIRIWAARLTLSRLSAVVPPPAGATACSSSDSTPVLVVFLKDVTRTPCAASGVTVLKGRVGKVLRTW